MNKLMNMLQGKPFGHPIHPALVHLPLGLLLLSLLFDVIGRATDAGNLMVTAAFNTMLFGVGAALLAAIPGLADWIDIRQDHPGRKVATVHMVLNLFAVGLYVFNLVIRGAVRDEAATPLLPIVLSILGVGILFVSGYLGGHLVYNDGIAVGRHRRKTGTPETTLRVSPEEAKEGGLVRVASQADLHDGETLRVELDGHVMTLVNLGGDVRAFQEFCTHRFGPLSEGAFVDGQVICPWHRSHFDIRTGKVTNGPAKVDLKVFEVCQRDGEIFVRVPEDG